MKKVFLFSLVLYTLLPFYPAQAHEPITVNVNHSQQLVQGLRDENDIYIPLSFMESFYETYSDVRNNVLYFRHTNAILREIEPYLPNGNYLNFHKIAVENWNNYFDGYSIPVNNFRWGQHYYPISILHYGLSHHNQLLKCQPDCDIATPYSIAGVNWVNYSGVNNIREVSDGIELSGLHNSFMLPINSTDSYISIDLTIRNPQFRIYLEVETTQGIKHIQLSPGVGNFNYPGNARYYFVGLPPASFKNNEKTTIFRDLRTDSSKMFNASFISLKSVKIRGNVTTHGVQTSETNHKAIVERVADWLIMNQDTQGGWPSHFDHLFYRGRTQVMESGWYSAMAQGLAISFLIRAYDILPDPQYLNAAERALSLYSIPVEAGGVLAHYNSMPIFEEYPTTPASHVLNGFIFALLGLYDLSEYTANPTARALYLEGFSTLENILPLYDMGNRSAYDLTHITAKTHPNIARWGYHATHIHQLSTLMSISNSPIIEEFHNRWYDYTLGYKVPPN